MLKDPTVDTSFLPDREREEMERQQREELRKEWLKRQEEIKSELWADRSWKGTVFTHAVQLSFWHIEETINITYSYWDGSGHRKVVQVKHSTRQRIGHMPHLVYLSSARKATALHSSWTHADNSFLSCVVSMWTTCCMSKKIWLFHM